MQVVNGLKVTIKKVSFYLGRKMIYQDILVSKAEMYNVSLFINLFRKKYSSVIKSCKTTNKMKKLITLKSKSL